MKMFWHENMNENPGYFKPRHNHPTINLFDLNWKKTDQQTNLISQK